MCRCSNGACSLHGVGSTEAADKSCISGPRSHVCNQDWSKNQYFLSGKLEALDRPGEWFIERGLHNNQSSQNGQGQGSRRLHFFPPVGQTCEAPDKEVEVKVRDYAFRQPAGPCKDKNNSLLLSLSGLRLRGASFGLGCCRGCTLSDLALEYPTYNKHVLEMDAPNTNCTPAAINNGHCPGRQKFGVGKLFSSSFFFIS